MMRSSSSPLNSLPPSSGRNPSQDSGAPRRRRSSRRRKKKNDSVFAVWQWLTLAALFLGIVAVFLYMGAGKGKLKTLRAEREEAKERYEREVQNHQVRYRDLIEQYAAEYNLNPAFVTAIIKNESSFDPQAVSSKGAMGLMQFMPSTFEWVSKNCGYRGADTSILYQPEAAIKMGCYLLDYIRRQLDSDDPILVACAYHAGWGTVPSWIEKYSSDGVTLTVEQIPNSDTRTYAGRVINSYAIYLQHYY